MSSLLATFTGCWHEPECDADCERVATVEVSPSEVRAAQGTGFQLSATARDLDARVILPSPKATWSGSTVVSGGNPATIAVSAPGTFPIKAKMGKKWSLEAKVIVAGPTEAAAGDMINVGHQPGMPPAYVLLDAKASGDASCAAANDRKFAVAGVATLPMNLVKGCDNEIVVFASGRAPLIETLEPTVWTDASETLERTPTAPLDMPVKAWYFVVDPDPIFAGNVDLKSSQTIFDENRAGIRQSPIEHTLMPIAKAYDGDEKCTGIENLLQFTADPAFLHVVYVTGIAWLSDPIAWACPDDPSRGDVVVISWSRWLPTVVAHEMVHRLGFSSPPFDFSTSGHVTGLAKFDETNVMWSPLDPASYSDRFYLALGQVYRLHAANESWLNRAKIRPAGLTTKACPKDMATGICPRVSLRAGDP